MSDRQLKIICFFLHRIYRAVVGRGIADDYKQMYEHAEFYADHYDKISGI